MCLTKIMETDEMHLPLLLTRDEAFALLTAVCQAGPLGVSERQLCAKLRELYDAFPREVLRWAA